MRAGSVWARVRDGLKKIAESEMWALCFAPDGTPSACQVGKVAAGTVLGPLRFRSKTGAEWALKKELKRRGW